jgi:hypothetical protein
MGHGRRRGSLLACMAKVSSFSILLFFDVFLIFLLSYTITFFLISLLCFTRSFALLTCFFHTIIWLPNPVGHLVSSFPIGSFAPCALCVR